MAMTDTTATAAAVQLKIEQATCGEQRLLRTLEMSLFVRELTKAGIRQQHPDWTEAQLGRELLRLAFLPNPLPPWIA